MKVENIANSMGTRLMNLKHFLGFLCQDKIFKKFMGPQEEMGVTLEDLTAGLAQLGQPLIKSITRKHKAGMNQAGMTLYRYQEIVSASIFAEMEAIMSMDLQGQPAKLIRKINERMFRNANLPKTEGAGDGKAED